MILKKNISSFIQQLLKKLGYAPFIGVSRHRMFTDGVGITTLAAFHSCPLRCKYCLNPQALRKDGMASWYTPMKLLKEVEKDDLYFRETDGGVTFGGGEPLLYPAFIKKFRRICPSSWKINIETSLNVSLETLDEVVDVIDTYIIDIKDMNPIVYENYTGHSISQVLSNLNYLIMKGKKTNMLIRIPLIPGYNNEEDVQNSMLQLEKLGLKTYERLTYTTTKPSRSDLNYQELLKLGKSKCEVLKGLRTEVAQKNDIEYKPRICNNTKPCNGTCPICEKELIYINKELYHGRKEYK